MGLSKYTARRLIFSIVIKPNQRHQYEELISHAPEDYEIDYFYDKQWLKIRGSFKMEFLENITNLYFQNYE